MVPVTFASQQFFAMAEGALFWPARSALVVADLHLGKASHFARRGQMLPPYDSIETIRRLEAALAYSGARELWALGDSFHDDHGPARLCPEARTRLRQIEESVSLRWIAGNHDASALPNERRAADMVIDGIALRHEAVRDWGGPEISGHFHPKITVSARGRFASRRCFVYGRSKLILPAFGSLTGGLDVRSLPVATVTGRPAEAIIVEGRHARRYRLGAWSEGLMRNS